MDHFLDKFSRASCTHKQKRQSVKHKNMVSLDQRQTAKTYTSPLKTLKHGVPMEILAENEKLRRENEVLQEYFATFEERYREQKKEN